MAVRDSEVRLYAKRERSLGFEIRSAKIKKRMQAGGVRRLYQRIGRMVKCREEAWSIYLVDYWR